MDRDRKVKLVFRSWNQLDHRSGPEQTNFGLGVVEITANNPSKIGILANASTVLADHGISIRQAVVDDPELSPDPKLTVIGDRVISGKAVPPLPRIPEVAKGGSLLVTETLIVTKGNIYRANSVT